MTRGPHSVSWENVAARVVCNEPRCRFRAHVESDDEHHLEEEVIALAEAHQRIHRRRGK